MKKIAVFGSYNGSSIGDNAILYGIISCLLGTDEEIEVTVLTMKKCIDFENESLFHFDESRIKERVINVLSSDKSSLSSRIKNIFNLCRVKLKLTSVIDETKLSNALSKCDLLLIGGGNLLMDYYPSWPNIIKDVCCTAQHFTIPYYFLGVGAGPIDRHTSALIFKDLINNSEACYVRDDKSKGILANLGITENVHVSVDLAFGIDNIVSCDVVRDRITVNLASVYAKGWPEEDNAKFEAYINQVLDVTNSLCSKYAVRKLEVFSSNFPLDNFACEYFIKRLPVEYTVIYTDKKLSVSEIIRLNQYAVASLVTRLHAGIMASKSCGNLYAIVYQPKVKTVLNQSAANLQTFDILSKFDGLAEFNNKENKENKDSNLATAKALISTILNGKKL